MAQIRYLTETDFKIGLELENKNLLIIAKNEAFGYKRDGCGFDSTSRELVIVISGYKIQHYSARGERSVLT